MLAMGPKVLNSAPCSPCWYTEKKQSPIADLLVEESFLMLFFIFYGFYFFFDPATVASYPPPSSPLKRKRSPSPTREASPEECAKADARIENQLPGFLFKVYNNMAHPLEVDKSDVDVWTEFCGSPVLRRQVALMGCDAVKAEEWYQKYGHDTYLTREEMYIYLVKLKNNDPTYDTNGG